VFTDNQGFSVVMLHPVEFATGYDGLTLKAAKVQVLRDLIAYGRTRWQFMTFTDAAAAVSNPVTAAPSTLAEPTVTVTPTVSAQPTVSLEPTETMTPTVSAQPTISLAPTVSVQPTVSFEPTVSFKPTVSAQPTVSFEPTSSMTPTVSMAPTVPQVVGPDAVNPVVIFRLENAQAWWCEDITQIIIDLFLEEGIALNVGVIGQNLDEDTFTANYLSSIASNPLIEFVPNSFVHESYEGQTYSWQSVDMANNNAMITKVTGAIPNSFIPPYNLYDTTTVDSCLANGMQILSAECKWSHSVANTVTHCKAEDEVVAPDIIRNGMYKLPAGAVLGGYDYWEDYMLDASLGEAVNWIDLQIGALIVT
jgi:hypothetical protein